MFQILFGFGTDIVKADWLNKALRTLFGMFDLVVYTLISFLYQILFAIADSGIISSEYMADFYARFQVILGVFMVFKLTISVLQYVVNPDLMTDKKQGLSNVITRVITMLAMLMAIMPLNIPSANAPDGSYNDYLNQHGLLFGTMYSLQSRILNQGVLEKLILGNTDLISSDDTELESDSDSGNSLDIEDSANKLAVGMLKIFIRPNLIDASLGEEDGNFMCCAKGNDGVFGTCTDVDGGRDDWYEYYNDESIDPATLIELLNVTCGKGSTDDNRYALAYMPVIPTICGALIIWVLVNFCIEIAKRAIRLAILRLIAPIPIISYIDPKSSEKGAFATWTKELVTAFLQLFLALGIIFFTINIVSHIMDAFTEQIWGNEGFKQLFDLPNPFKGNPLVNSVALIFIVVAIFLFAKEAPRFIMNALGIKGSGYGLGFAGALGGLGAMMEGAGLRGLLSGSANAMQDSSDAYAQGKAAPPTFGSQADRVRQMLTGDKTAHGGMFGRWQRAANDRTNIGMARRYLGLDRNISGQAKEDMYALQGELADAQRRYERFTRGEMTDAERADVERSNGFYNGFTGTSAFAAHASAYDAAHGSGAFSSYWNSLSDAAKHGEVNSIYSSLSNDERDYAMTQVLESDMSRKQSESGKQDAWFKESSQLMEGFSINETLQEKYSGRGEGAYRANRMYTGAPGYSAPVRGQRNYARSHQYRTERGKQRTGRATDNSNGPQSNV